MEAFADGRRPADAVEEFGLEESGDAECWRGKGDAEGGIGADQEVLEVDVSSEDKRVLRVDLRFGKLLVVVQTNLDSLLATEEDL